MNEVLLNPATALAVEQFVARPSHALLIIAPTGAGKTTVAQHIAAQLLAVPHDKLAGHPYYRLVQSQNGKTISIDRVRDVIQFLRLKTGERTAVSRVVVVEHAQLMSTQAQNALLKTIEEPPEGTVLILTAPSELDMLPTIRSRAQKFHVCPPNAEQLAAHCKAAGYSESAINRALAMSDGLPGLTYALLTDDASHPLVGAAALARELLQQSTFERVVAVDELAKQKEQWLNLLFIFSRMAEMSLRKAATPTAARKWQTILAASHTAREQTLASGQIKLIILNFMLTI